MESAYAAAPIDTSISNWSGLGSACRPGKTVPTLSRPPDMMRVDTNCGARDFRKRNADRFSSFNTPSWKGTSKTMFAIR